MAETFIRQAKGVGPLKPAVFLNLPSVDDFSSRESLAARCSTEDQAFQGEKFRFGRNLDLSPATKTGVIEYDRLLWQPRKFCRIATLSFVVMRAVSSSAL